MQEYTLFVSHPTFYQSHTQQLHLLPTNRLQATSHQQVHDLIADMNLILCMITSNNCYCLHYEQCKYSVLCMKAFSISIPSVTQMLIMLFSNFTHI